VREALRRLEAEGYVDFKRNLGAAVRHVDAEGYAQTMQTLAILEASATAMAAPYVTKKDIKTARKLNKELVASLEELDPVMFGRLNHELHRTLYQPCPNAYLLSMVEREWTRLRGIRQSAFAFVPSRARQALRPPQAVNGQFRQVVLIAEVVAFEQPRALGLEAGEQDRDGLGSQCGVAADC
jgi:DNA-binding GntR family transcriptional regulator